MHPRPSPMACLGLVAAAALFAGCALPDDWDGDGYPASEDCDDLDPERNPSAIEIPADGIDQDCRGGDPQQRAEGLHHDCVLSLDGTVSCEGDNSRGQLNMPDTEDDDGWVQIAAGEYHTCALNIDGEVTCWGDDTYGQSSPPRRGPFLRIAAQDYASFGGLPPHPDGSPGGSLCWGNCVVD